MRTVHVEADFDDGVWDVGPEPGRPCDARYGDVNSISFPLLGSVNELPRIRSRLHTICALYAHTPRLEERLKLLDLLETMTLQAAHVLATELLECGWRAEPEEADGAG